MLPSFEEKSVWVQLIALTVSLGGYSVVSGIMLGNGVRGLVPFVPVFAVTVVLLVAVMVVGHIVAAVMNRPEPRDERDRLIGWRAESNSSWVLGVGAFCAISALIVDVQAVWVAHLLLASMFASEMLKLSLQIVYYRRGI